MTQQRLVIRVKIVSEGGAPPSAGRRVKWGVLALVAAVLGLLAWFVVARFGDPPAVVPAAIEVEPVPKSLPAAPLPAPRAVDAPPSPVNQVIPQVPRRARETIRGTIKVSVRVSIDRQGAVLAADTVERGPSRYFERLAIEAAKQWAFTPASAPAERTVLLNFDFKRTGANVRVNIPAQ